MSAVAVSLREWETLTPATGGPLAQRSLSSEPERQLAERLTTTGRIEVLELARGIELRAKSFVGRFRLGDITVTVRPKISGAPLMKLLRYAYGLRDLHLYESVGYGMAEWSFQDLLIRQLIAEVSELLARGIHRDYERYNAELRNPRGRIEFNRLAGATFHAKPVLPCVYYPRSDDTILNQVVLGGLMHAAALTIDADMRSHIRALTQRLAQTVSLKKLDITIINEVVEGIDRRTTVYKPALLLIDLLFHAHGVLLDGESDRISLPGFLFDMNRFFQALISRFLHDHLDSFEIQDEYRLKDLFYYDPYRNPLRRRAPAQKPDFVIRHGRRIAAILDAKYRDLWEGALPREMLYQVSLYALGSSVHRRKAVILYPSLSADAREQAILIREPVNGLAEAEVVLRPVNLLLMERLLRAKNATARRRRAALAHQLSFGSEPEI